MSRIDDIAAEITNGEAIMSYAALITTPSTDAEEIHKDPVQQTINKAIADRMNATDTGRTANVTSLTKLQILEAIEDVDLVNINSAVNLVFQLDTIDPWNAKIVSVFQEATFSAGTMAALNALRTKTVSRAEELNLNTIKVGEIAMARVKLLP